MTGNYTKKRNILLVDLAMVVCFLTALAFQLTGGMAHEWTGLGLCVLFGIHLASNRRWFTTLRKGRYGVRRLVSSTVTILLILCMAADGPGRPACGHPLEETSWCDSEISRARTVHYAMENAARRFVRHGRVRAVGFWGKGHGCETVPGIRL